MQNQPNNIPTIGINQFRFEQTAGREEIISNELIGEKHIAHAHKHDFFIIILFDQASGIHNIDSVEYNVGNKEVHILFPEQMHKWNIFFETTGYQLMIEKEFLEQFAPYFRYSFTNYQNHPVIKLTNDAFEKLKYEFKAIMEELQNQNSLIHLIRARAAVIAAIVSSEAESLFTEFKVYQSNERLAKFNTLIDNYYKQEKSVAFYADQLHISANYLNIICKKELKLTAKQLIYQKIITEAKRLLQNKNITIKEAAFQLGFLDTSYFTNFFKQQVRMTPSEFKEME